MGYAAIAVAAAAAVLAGCGGAGGGAACTPSHVASTKAKGHGPIVAPVAFGGFTRLIWDTALVPDPDPNVGTQQLVETWTTGRADSLDPAGIMPADCAPLCTLWRVKPSDRGAGFLWSSSGTSLDFSIEVERWDGKSAATWTVGPKSPNNILPEGYLSLGWVDGDLVATKPAPMYWTPDPGLTVARFSGSGPPTEFHISIDLQDVAPDAHARVVDLPGAGGMLLYDQGKDKQRHIVSRHLGTSLGPAKMIGQAGDGLVDAVQDGGGLAALICREGGLVLLRDGEAESLPGVCAEASLVRAGGRLFVLHDDVPLTVSTLDSSWWYLDSVDGPGEIAPCSPNADNMTVADSSGSPAFLWAEEKGGVLSLMQMPAGI